MFLGLAIPVSMHEMQGMDDLRVGSHASDPDAPYDQKFAIYTDAIYLNACFSESTSFVALGVAKNDQGVTIGTASMFLDQYCVE